MKRKLITVFAVLTLLVGAVAIPTGIASAGVTAVVTITATPEFLCMSIAYNGAHDSSWAVTDDGETTVSPSSVFWWMTEGTAQAEPGWPLDAGNCSAILTNCGSILCDIDVEGIDFTGGVGWTLTTGAPGEDTVQLTAYPEGCADEATGIEVELTPGGEFYDSLAADAELGIELSLATGTFTDGEPKSGSVTWTIRAHS